MKEISSFFDHRMLWTTGAALLAIVAVPAIVGLVLNALGLMYGVSPHSWLLDFSSNAGAEGALGAVGAAAASAGNGSWNPP